MPAPGEVWHFCDGIPSRAGGDGHASGCGRRRYPDAVREPAPGPRLGRFPSGGSAAPARLRPITIAKPKRIFELRPIKWLLERNTIVIAAGGGGIPTIYEPGAHRKLVGVECVIDKDLTSELLARELDADLFVMPAATAR